MDRLAPAGRQRISGIKNSRKPRADEMRMKVRRGRETKRDEGDDNDDVATRIGSPAERAGRSIQNLGA